MTPTLTAIEVGRVAAIFGSRAPNGPVLSSVLGGRRPGRAFVDSLGSPRTALVVSDYGFAFTSAAEVDDATLACVAGLAGSMTVYLVWPDTDRRTDVPVAGARWIERRELGGRCPGARDGAGPGCVGSGAGAIVPIDRALFERCRWRGEVVRACGSAEAFLTDGLGFCAVRGDVVAAEAYGVFPGEDAIEIGITTHPDWRRQGLAKQACAVLVDAIQRSGLTTVWSCHASNLGSLATARSLGYPHERSYRMLQVGPPG